MGGLDRLLANSMDKIIRENLGEKTIRRIEKRLFEKYGISLNQAMEQFHKIDSVLREIFGVGADELERKVLQSICSTNKSKTRGSKWISIIDPIIINNILEAYGDDDKKMILNLLSEEPKIISEVLSYCKIPQTSGYRKINSLISNGLLIPEGFAIGKDGKKIIMYKSIFENVRINILKNKYQVDVQASENFLDDSSILHIIVGT